MRSALLLVAFFVIYGCKPIDKLEPNQTETFLKFYSETDQMEAKDLIVVDDGYLIIGTDTDTSTVLLKTDLLGNKTWATSLPDFRGSGLTLVDDGYIIIGDSINNIDLTFMKLIKTDFTGNITNSVSFGKDYSHGVATTFTSINEVIGLGYVDHPDSNAYIVLRGYGLNLDSAWASIRSYKVTNEDRVPYKSIYESNDGNLTWLNFAQGNSTKKLEATIAQPDNNGLVANPILFNGSNVSNVPGDLVKTPVGYAASQSISVSGQNKIGVSAFDQNVFDEEVISALEGNYMAHSITNAPNGLLVAAATDQHEDATERTDKDLLLLEVEYSGAIKTDGINVNYGGLGDEIPIRIRNTNDGGYAIFGTIINTKGAKQLFLLKTDKKGAIN